MKLKDLFIVVFIVFLLGLTVYLVKGFVDLIDLSCFVVVGTGLYVLVSQSGK
jgi:hypothetical protein